MRVTRTDEGKKAIFLTKIDLSSYVYRKTSMKQFLIASEYVHN